MAMAAFADMALAEVRARALPEDAPRAGEAA
jgi:hypothetical protein